MRNTQFKNNKGFTLVELMVVIVIIGLLASIILVSTKNIRGKARDSRRVIEIDRLYKSMEVCFYENGNYPNSNESDYFDFWEERDSVHHYKYVHSCSGCWAWFLYYLSTPSLGGCVPTKIIDPLNENPHGYYYFYFETNATTYNGNLINSVCKGKYALMAHLENPTLENAGVSGEGCFNESGLYEYWRIFGK